MGDRPTPQCHCGDPATLTTTAQRKMCAPCAYAVHETCSCSYPAVNPPGAGLLDLMAKGIIRPPHPRLSWWRRVWMVIRGYR